MYLSQFVSRSLIVVRIFVIIGECHIRIHCDLLLVHRDKAPVSHSSSFLTSSKEKYDRIKTQKVSGLLPSPP